jgi:hypothetical protein
MYVNGVELTSFSISNDPALNTDYSINQNAIHTLGSAENFSALYKLDGYLAEIHFIDGQQLDPTSFGEVNSDTGQWVPIKYTGSATGNSFYITGETASDLGEDFSGNNNDWTSSGLGGAADQMSDSPTNNWCTLSPLSSPLTRSSAMSEGNLKWRNTSDGTSFYIGCAATQRVLGKCYWEVTNTYDGTGTIRTGLFPRASLIQNDYPGGAFGADCIGLVATIGRVDRNGVAGTTYTGAGSGDVNMYAFDEDAGKLWIGLNGTWFNSGDPAGGTGEVAGSIVQSPLFPATSGYGTSSGNFQEFNFGQSAFAYTPPTDFLALNSANLPDPTIADPSDYFTPYIYTGDNSGTSRVFTGVGFAPNLVWTKSRAIVNDHSLFDTVRGTGKYLSSSYVAAGEITNPSSGYLTAFGSDGYTFSDGSSLTNPRNNYNAATTYVSWNWNAPTTSTNTDGSVATSLSVNQTSGLSIGTFDGTGANLTAGHGLGVAPDFIMATVRPNATNWNVYHSAIGNTGALRLNLANAVSTSAQYWNNTSPTSTVITFGTNSSSNSSGNSTVFYAFTEVEGFSKFTSFAGNGSSNGPFIYTGFRPAYVLVKVSSGSTGSWRLFDTSRNPYNVTDKLIYPNLANAEATSAEMDILSNGFKIKVGSGYDINDSGDTMIVAAFAETPFKTANAR